LVGGVMITASHNPASFNGFKVKAHFGGSATPAITAQIEKNLELRRGNGAPRPFPSSIHSIQPSGTTSIISRRWSIGSALQIPS
jgi:phosphomannomutase